MNKQSDTTCDTTHKKKIEKKNEKKSLNYFMFEENSKQNPSHQQFQH